MAQTLEQLGQHEQALRSIHSIVHTMKTLAAVNVSPYEQAAQAIDAYHHSVRDGFAAFAHASRRQDGDDAQLPQSFQAQTAASATDTVLMVAFGSDHGFCGSYNETLADHLQQHAPRSFLQSASTTHTTHTTHRKRSRLLCIGARLAQALAERGFSIDQQLMPAASVDGISRLAGDIVRRIEQSSDERSFASLKVSLAWTTRTAHGSSHPRLSPLLPLPAELLAAPARWPSPSLPSYRLPAPALLAALIRQHLFASVFRAIAEAMATENAARLALMQQAEQNVEERLSALRQEIAHQRQETITSELMDLISGHEP